MASVPKKKKKTNLLKIRKVIFTHIADLAIWCKLFDENYLAPRFHPQSGKWVIISIDDDDWWLA